MPSFHRIIPLALLCALLFPVSVIGGSDVRTVPLSTITSSDGSIDLSDYRGRVVYVDFWASWCRPCRRSFPWMQRMHYAYHERGLVILAVNLDRERAAADRFLESAAPTFPIVFDADAVLARAHELKALPSSFIYGPDGTLHASHTGFREGDTSGMERTIVSLLDALAAAGASR